MNQKKRGKEGSFPVNRGGREKRGDSSWHSQGKRAANFKKEDE